MHDETHEGDAAPAATCAAGETNGELQQLRGELAKWRGRVPKLAAALRQRTEELESLKRRRSALHAHGPASDATPGGDAGIRVRDELIAELEAKLGALDQNLRRARGELHARSLEVTDLQGNVRGWKQKWQALTQSLDAQAQELSETRADRDSLLERNEKLFETTELANRQIETLADNLAELRLKAREAADREAAASRARDKACEEAQRLTVRATSLSEQVQELEAYAQTLCASAMTGSRDAVADRQQLEERAAAAAQRAAQAETAIEDMRSRQQHLERQLNERSQLVVELEQRACQQGTLTQALEQEKQGLQEALLRAEREARENAEHVTQLDDRLERQKLLLANLEQELAEAHAASAAAANRERWERERAEAENREAPDGRMLPVLRQQLEQARAKNASLLERIRDLEEEVTHVRMQRGGDDLTRIHGVGPKLAQQLNELGIYRLEQIAELDAERLADRSHVLHAHKGRIVRDGWIEQAARLIRH